MFGKKKQTSKSQQVYTDEQLRYMIAPSVADSVARAYAHPGNGHDLSSKVRTVIPKSVSTTDLPTSSPDHVPVLGSIGNSARSRAQITAYREKIKER